MRSVRSLVVGAILCGCCVASFAAEKEPAVTVAKYDGNKDAAISYTFDDGLRDQYTIAAPMLDAHGFHGTFFIITKPTAATPAEGQAYKPGKFGGISWPELKDLSARGHEIANHTWTHRDLRKIPPAEVEPEFDLADRDIVDHLGFAPLTVAYTANSFDERIRALALKKHVADRTFQTAFGGPDFTLEKANEWLDKTLQSGGWSVAMIHGIVAGFYPFKDTDILARHLDYARAHADRLWIDTFCRVANYVRTRDAATIRDIHRSRDGMTFTLEGNLPRSAAGIEFPPAPLTLKISDSGARSAIATRGGKALPAIVKNGVILIEALPSTEPITVKWTPGG